jgi:hypothetical protein
MNIARPRANDKDIILIQLDLAKKNAQDAIAKSLDSIKNIDNAYALTNADIIPPIEPPVGDFIPVKNGDNLISMIDSNPAGTKFLIANDFVQDVHDRPISKPCYLKSERATLVGDIRSVATDVTFYGLVFNGRNENMLPLGDRNTVNTCLLNGNPNGQHRGILVNAEDCTIIDTRVLNIFKDIDTQAVVGWDRTKRLKVLRCELEASGENVLFGGSTANGADNIPSDCIIAECTLNKRESWKDDPRASCKNFFEVKNGKNIKLVKCIGDFSPVDAQSGYAVVLTPRNQNNDNTFTVVEDILVEDCDFTRIGGGINILGNDYIHPSQQTKRVTFRRNTFDVQVAVAGGNGRLYILSRGPEDVLLEENVFSGGQYIQGQYFDDPSVLCKRLIYRKNFFVEGEYGIVGSGAPALGKAVLDMYAPGYVWEDNTVQRSHIRYINWPPGTILVG